MGIRDFFKNKSSKNNNLSNLNNLYNSDNPDCKLSYRSGINADVSFKDIEEVYLDNGSMKRLQSVNVMYNLPDDTFKGQKYYMDPVFDEDGNNITKETYLNLASNNMPLLKGFFAKEQVEKEPTNYIGSIGYDNSGKPFRSKDRNFEESYKNMLNRKMEDEIRADNEKFKVELSSNVESIETHIKPNHAEDLSGQEFPGYKRNSDENIR